jgi:mycoredoxin
MDPRIIFFGHNFCPQVHTIRATLDHIGLRYDYIDIRKDDAGRQRVNEINNGFESVPTLVFSDGSTLTEPSEDALYTHLDALGFRLDPPTAIDRIKLNIGNPIISAFGVGVVIGGGVFSSLPVVVVGVVLVLMPLVVRYLYRK